MSQGKKMVLLAVAVIALIGVGIVQQPIDFLRYNPKAKESGLLAINVIGSGNKKTQNLVFDLPVQFFGAAALGLREAVASMLWVRADEFFHTGQYEAILPIVRLVTWLDPQQIDVYTTGAWHLDYNFVDSEERSDRRYIPPAVKLLEEGIQNNPEIYDLYFELAWTHYFQKAKKYDKAIYWMKKAVEKPSRDPNTGRVVPHPAFVSRMLAHAYERAGDFDNAEKQWNKCIAESMRQAKAPGDEQDLTVSRKNLGLFLLRRGWRYGDMGAFERGVKVLSDIKVPDEPQKKALDAAKASLAQWKATGFVPHDDQPPVDAKMSVSWKRVKSRVIEVSGTLSLVPVGEYKNLASEPYTRYYEDNLKKPEAMREKWRDGCRVRVMLVDDGYDWWNLPQPKEFSWEVDRTQTVLWDDTSARGGTFDIRIDMTKDHNIYPLAKERYKLIVWFNPQEAPDFVQDRIGWKGEGLTDKRYIDTKTNPGYRMLIREFTLTKHDII